MTFQDFGFNSDDFTGNNSTIPYCQFLNSSNKHYGIAITPQNVEIAGFKPTDDWEKIDHEFNDGTSETMLYTKTPKVLVIQKSGALMTNGQETIIYDKQKFNTGDYKAFSYLVVWFLDENNKPLSTMPFRLKCGGYAGLTFVKNYSYYNNSNSFCSKYLAIYKELSGDKSSNKNQLFYAHAVYEPTMERKKAVSSFNGQSSMAVQTTGFKIPTPENFAQILIHPNSEIGKQIKAAYEDTQAWVDVERFKSQSVNETEEDESGINIQSSGDESLTPEPLPF